MGERARRGMAAARGAGARGGRARARTSGFEMPIIEMPIPALPVPHAEPMHANTSAIIAPLKPSSGAYGGHIARLTTISARPAKIRAGGGR